MNAILDRRSRTRWLGGALALLILVGLPAACGGSSRKKKKKKKADPEIVNINGSSDPASPVNVAIEINGLNLGTNTGEVHFTDALDPTNVAIVTPTTWTEEATVAVVPAAGSVAAFAVPGVVQVHLVTNAGKMSNTIDLDLVDTPTFAVNNVTWQTSTALPVALAGLGAVPSRVDDVSAYVVVAGGFDGVANRTEVYTNTLAQDGTLGPTWTTEANGLPLPRAHFAMVQANPQNAPLIDLNDRFVYVIGGQESASDTPGGVDTVYRARVSSLDGSVGSWSQMTALPEPLVGTTATVYNGHVYLIGGLRTDGTPTDALYSSRIQGDGTLGSWEVQPDPYPFVVAFAGAFGFGGNLYVFGGDTGNSTDPNADTGTPIKAVTYAPALRGDVGTWTATSEPNKERFKHNVWASFGQIIIGEGLYSGSAGSSEMSVSALLPNGAVGAWGGLTGSNNPNANVYNAASFTSPIRAVGQAPRFILIGGMEFPDPTPGIPSSAVYYNDAP